MQQKNISNFDRNSKKTEKLQSCIMKNKQLHPKY